MKKLLVLALIPLLGVASVNEHVVTNKNNEAPKYLSSTIISTFLSKLKGAHKIESNVTTSTKNNYLHYDEVEDTARYFKLSKDNVVTFEDYVISDSNNFAYKTKINISNNAETLPLFEDDGKTQLTFQENYGSAFRRLVNISENQFNSYFIASETSDNIKLTLTDLGYGFLNHDLSDFFYYVEEYVWDNASYNIYIDDVEFLLDKDGTLNSFNFKRVQKDKFGGFFEDFACKISYISRVKRLEGLEAKMDDSNKNIFLDKVNNFQAKINQGNFTQNIKNTVNGGIEYNTYFVFDSLDPIIPSMMVSDLALYDMSYGQTFFGVLPVAGAYTPYAFSPESDFMDTYSNLNFATFEELLPNFARISADFFEFKNERYILDFTSLTIVDYSFSVDILNALLTSMDPILVHTNTYIDFSIFDYNLQTLTIVFDEENNLSAHLTYLTSGSLEKVSISFKDFNQTDIRNVEALKGVIDLLINY